MIDLACSLALVGLGILVAIAYAGRVARVGAARHPRIDKAGGSVLLGEGAMEMGYWAMRPLANLLVRRGVGANAISWACLVLAGLASAALATGHFGVAAALSVASAACDALDGFVARATGTASDAGEVLDAAIDRYAELLFFGGVAFYERADAPVLVLTLAATAGALMVSYGTAKAEALAVKPPRGAMRRQERAVYLVLGTALVPFAEVACAARVVPHWVATLPLLAALLLVAVVGNVSAVRRLGAVARLVGRPARSSTPAEVAKVPAPERSTPRVGVRLHEVGSNDALTRDGHAATGNALR